MCRWLLVVDRLSNYSCLIFVVLVVVFCYYLLLVSCSLSVVGCWSLIVSYIGCCCCCCCCVCFYVLVVYLSCCCCILLVVWFGCWLLVIVC